jgi:ATP-dependent RNA helicase DHX36
LPTPDAEVDDIDGGRTHSQSVHDWLQQLKRRGEHSARALDLLALLSHAPPSVVDASLVVAVVRDIALYQPDGAILCFLPGWDDIKKVHDLLKKQAPFADEARFLIVPLHSLMPTATQKTVFDRPPPGVRKVVLATNIAETSITIDDVVYVVDCGRAKEKGFDPVMDIDSLQIGWISRAAVRQRKGRAGRCQPGLCAAFGW